MSTPNHRRHFGALGATASGIKVSSGGRELQLVRGWIEVLQAIHLPRNEKGRLGDRRGPLPPE
jgi:hypothetical protein